MKRPGSVDPIFDAPRRSRAPVSRSSSPGGYPTGALPDPDKEISTIRLFRGNVSQSGQPLPFWRFGDMLFPGQGPAHGSLQKDHPLTGRLRSPRSSWAICYRGSSLLCSPPTPLPRRRPLGVASRTSTSGANAFLNRPTVHSRTAGASDTLGPGSPMPRIFRRTNRGLPGYWVVRCLRAVVSHPAG
jgi:hypothetical protein